MSWGSGEGLLGKMSNPWRRLKKCTLCPHKSVYRSLKAFILDQVNKQRIKIRILLFSSQMNFKLNVTEAFCIKVLA